MYRIRKGMEVVGGPKVGIESINVLQSFRDYTAIGDLHHTPAANIHEMLLRIQSFAL